MNTIKPIWNNREVIGYAKTTKQAERIIRDKHQRIPRGWIISVRERDTSIIQLPDGFVYCVSYKY